MIREFLGKCSKCKIRVDEALIRKHEEFTDIINKLMVEGHVNRIFHDLLQSAIELFHFNDCHFLQYLNICYNMLDESDKAKKREVAQLLLKNYDQHRPKFDPAKGNFINNFMYLVHHIGTYMYVCKIQWRHWQNRYLNFQQFLKLR